MVQVKQERKRTGIPEIESGTDLLVLSFILFILGHFLVFKSWLSVLLLKC